MKTKFLVPVLLMVAMNMSAGSANEPSYVITNHDTTLCKRVNLGLTDAKIELLNGSTKEVSKDAIMAFKTDGRQFERKTLFDNNKPTGVTAFMELLGQRNGLKLYCYNVPDDLNPDNNSITVNGVRKSAILLVYKNNDFYVQVTKINAPTLLDFFHINGVIFE
jgi:hypothetical protein